MDGSPCSAKEVQKTSDKRNADENSEGRGKRRRQDTQDGPAAEWQTRFIEIWEYSRGKNARFESSVRMFHLHVPQNRQMPKPTTFWLPSKIMLEESKAMELIFTSCIMHLYHHVKCHIFVV